jgi:hypothetical protein
MKKQIIINSVKPKMVNKVLCEIYGLDYDKVIQDKKKVFKYLNYITYFEHKMGYSKNNYFSYLEKYYLVQYGLSHNFNMKYSKVFFFHLYRIFSFFFCKI